MPLGYLALQKLQPGGDPLQIVLDQFGFDPLANGFEDIRAFLGQLLHFGLRVPQGGILGAPQGVESAGVFLAEDVEQVIAHQVGLEGGQYLALQHLPLDRLAVGADALALVLGGRAAVMRGVDLGIPPAAHPAAQEPGEQIARAVAVPQAVRPGIQVLLAGFGCLPEVLRDNPQLRNVLSDPRAFVIEARDALAGGRVLDEALAVPDKTPDIKLVIQDAGSPAAVAVDRALPPRLSGRRGDGFRIQLRRDRLGGAVLHRVLLKDAPDDRGLRFIDRALALERLTVGIKALDHLIAIRDPAARLAVLHPSAQTPAGFIGKVFKKQRVHGSLQADMKGGDRPFREGDHLHPGELHALVHTGDVFLVAA